MRTSIGSLAGLASKAFTALLVIFYIADDILATAANHVSWWWDGVKGKRREPTAQELADLEEQARRDENLIRNGQVRPGIIRP